MRYPYREILTAKTNEWNDRDLSPDQAYEDFVRELDTSNLDYTTYVSSAISSGGFTRDTSLSRKEAMESNTRAAHHMAASLYNTAALTPDETIEAVSLGYIPQWKQSDYMQFWMHVMSRPDVSSEALAGLSRYVQNAGIDWPTYNTSSHAHEVRRPQYTTHVDTYLSQVEPLPHRPIDRVIQLIDAEQSLGAYAEKRMARRIGATVYNLSIIGEITQLEDASLRYDLQHLDAIGAAFLRKRTGAMLELCENDE